MAQETKLAIIGASVGAVTVGSMLIWLGFPVNLILALLGGTVGWFLGRSLGRAGTAPVTKGRRGGVTEMPRLQDPVPRGDEEDLPYHPGARP